MRYKKQKRPKKFGLFCCVVFLGNLHFHVLARFGEDGMGEGGESGARVIFVLFEGDVFEGEIFGYAKMKQSLWGELLREIIRYRFCRLLCAG